MIIDVFYKNRIKPLVPCTQRLPLALLGGYSIRKQVVAIREDGAAAVVGET